MKNKEKRWREGRIRIEKEVEGGERKTRREEDREKEREKEKEEREMEERGEREEG